MTGPAAAMLPFIKRDLLNLAMRNIDNPRYTALRKAEGHILLTPLSDFAPMDPDPDLIPHTQTLRQAW